MEQQVNTNRLVPVFKAVLEYDDSIDIPGPAVPLPGTYIGKGKGTIEGEQISGRFFWKLHAENCAFLWIQEGDAPPPDMHLCNTYFTGMITTDNNAEISFDARGYGFRGFDPKQPHLWSLTAALRFGTDNEQFQYLNSTLGCWEGRFNEKEKRASYRAFLSNPNISS